MKRVFIVVMVGRLNYLPPDLTMNKLSSQTIRTTTYQHFKNQLVIRSIITSP